MCAAVTLQTFREKGWQHGLEEMHTAAQMWGIPARSCIGPALQQPRGSGGLG